jgi:hypothetical protein
LTSQRSRSSSWPANRTWKAAACSAAWSISVIIPNAASCFGNAPLELRPVFAQHVRFDHLGAILAVSDVTCKDRPSTLFRPACRRRTQLAACPLPPTRTNLAFPPPAFSLPNCSTSEARAGLVQSHHRRTSQSRMGLIDKSKSGAETGQQKGGTQKEPPDTKTDGRA